MGKKESIEVIISNCLTFINNILNTPEILAGFEKRGKTKAYFLALKAEVEEIQQLLKKQLLSRTEKDSILEKIDLLFEETYSTYMDYVTLGRVFFRDDNYSLELLELNGLRKDTISGFTVQGKRFYENILETDKIKKVFNDFAVEDDVLKGQLLKIKELSELSDGYVKGKGESIHSTAEKDKKVDKVKREVTDLKIIAKVIFKNQPTVLKILGIVLKS